MVKAIPGRNLPVLNFATIYRNPEPTGLPMQTVKNHSTLKCAYVSKNSNKMEALIFEFFSILS